MAKHRVKGDPQPRVPNTTEELLLSRSLKFGKHSQGVSVAWLYQVAN